MNIQSFFYADSRRRVCKCDRILDAVDHCQSINGETNSDDTIKTGRK